jgi:ZIP family zinc transporter
MAARIVAEARAQGQVVSSATVLSALVWGLVGSSSLVIGAVAGVVLHVPRRALGLLLGFGAGALVSAISFELADEALHQGGPGALAAGLAAG